MRGIQAISVVLGAVLLASCGKFGSRKLVSTHTAYNDAVQLTVTREVLTNIVRARYSDPMQFVKVASINAQFSVSVGGSAGVAGGGGAVTGLGGGNIGYSDSPTITYVPASDAAFYKSLYSLFQIEEGIGFGLGYRFARMGPGWQALSLRFTFGAINTATDAAGARGSELYNTRIAALVRLFELGASYQLFPEWDTAASTIPRAKVTAEDEVEAFKWGLYFVEEQDGKSVRLARYRLVVALVLPAPDDPEVVKALETLDVTPGQAKYVLRPPTDSFPGVQDPYAIRVTPRSMADALVLATHFVEVPTAHTKIVPPIDPIAGDPELLSSIRIRSSEKEPPFPYRTRHRGYWFYVDDSDLQSKMFLEAMVAAYTSRVGSKQATDAGPQIVLPAGGG